MSLVGFCINNTVYATIDISANQFQLDRDPVRFDLIKVESDLVSINQYEYNYILLYSNGECKCYTKSNGQKTSFTGYYKLNTATNKINIFTKEHDPFYFISPDEHTYINYNSIIVTGTLYGKFVKFEYKLF